MDKHIDLRIVYSLCKACGKALYNMDYPNNDIIEDGKANLYLILLSYNTLAFIWKEEKLT